ncbi:hypothetical protein Hanom_Chr17g01530111 [Helianthus anomalus]
MLSLFYSLGQHTLVAEPHKGQHTLVPEPHKPAGVGTDSETRAASSTDAHKNL